MDCRDVRRHPRAVDQRHMITVGLALLGTVLLAREPGPRFAIREGIFGARFFVRSLLSEGSGKWTTTWPQPSSNTMTPGKPTLVIEENFSAFGEDVGNNGGVHPPVTGSLPMAGSAFTWGKTPGE